MIISYYLSLNTFKWLIPVQIEFELYLIVIKYMYAELLIWFNCLHDTRTIASNNSKKIGDIQLTVLYCIHYIVHI